MSDQTARPRLPSRSEHRRILSDAAGPNGWRRSVGDGHDALFRSRGETLLVSFEDLGSVRRRAGALPWDSGLAEKRGWSTLSILSHGRTWFREPALHDLFDGLTDDGFFDDFDSIVFVGARAGGYAAAAYSVAAPGATVFLVQPYATLDRDEAPWEQRFRSDRHLSFGPRYGYAPDMLDAAARAFVVSDPTETADAMHASLFRGRHITHLRARHAGSDVWARLESIGILDRLVAGAEADALTPLRFAQLWRARRRDPVWITGLQRKLDGLDRPWLTALFAGHRMAHAANPAARRRLNQALAQLDAMGRDAPEGLSPRAPEDGDRPLLAGE